MRVRCRERHRNPDITNNIPRTTAFSAVVGRVLLAAALLTASVPAPAFAKPPDAVQQFASAQKLFDSGDFAGALPLFRQLLDSTGSPNARLYVARCLRELGRLPEAFEQMDTTQRDAAVRAESESKYIQTRDAATVERAILESRIGRLIIAVANPPADVQVILNDEPLSADRLGSATTVKPGTMILTVEAAGMRKIQRRVSVAAGETKTVALTLQSLEEVKPPPPPPPLPVQRQEPPKLTGGGVRTAGIVVTSFGVAGLAAAGVSWFLSDQKFRGATDECGSPCTVDKLEDIKSSVRTLETISTASLIGGIVGTATGVVMIIVGGPTMTPATSATLSVSPRSAMVGYTVAF